MSAGSDLFDQTLAVIFKGIPKDYTCKDILLNHLSNPKKKNKNANANKQISAKSLERWRRIIRVIHIDSSTQEAHVIFSSIFYFCKYSRNAFNRQTDKISAIIHPKWFKTIKRPSNIDLISSTIKLFNIPPSIISYSFIANDTVFISTKRKTHNNIDQELLIKIPSTNISNINLLKYLKNKSMNASEVILELHSQCAVFEYYHQDKIWKCNQCNTINCINNNTQKPMLCVCCNKEIDANNCFFYRQINELFSHCNVGNTNLSVNKFIFVQQTRFYRKLSAFDTDISCNERFNVLSPLMNVLDDTKRSIPSCIMFSNIIKLCFAESFNETQQYFDKNIIKMDTNIIATTQDYKHLNTAKCRESLLGLFVWLSDKFNSLIFPLLFRLFDFKNSVAFSDDLDEYIAKIEELIDMGSMPWLLSESVMSMNSLSVTDLDKKVVEMENNYEDKGIFDIDDPKSKTFVYELELSPFKIGIKECNQRQLEKNEEWMALDTVSTENYVVSFAMGGIKTMCDTFKNCKQRMQFYDDYTLIDENKPNTLMHHLWNDEALEFYGATICNRPMDDDEMKADHRNIAMDQEEDEHGDNSQDAAKYVIDKSNVYQRSEPPLKKQKMSNIKVKGIDSMKSKPIVNTANNNEAEVSSMPSHTINIAPDSAPPNLVKITNVGQNTENTEYLSNYLLPPLPTKQLKSVGWECKHCAYMNVETVQQCAMCSNTKTNAKPLSFSSKQNQKKVIDRFVVVAQEALIVAMIHLFAHSLLQ